MYLLEKMEFSPAWVEMSCCRQVFSSCGGGPLERMGGCLRDLDSALIFAVHLKLHTNASSLLRCPPCWNNCRDTVTSLEKCFEIFFSGAKEMLVDISVYMGALLAAGVFLRTSGKRLLLYWPKYLSSGFVLQIPKAVEELCEAASPAG